MKSFFIIINIIFIVTISSASELPKKIIIAKGNGQYPPYEMTVNKELVGFHIELIKSVASIMGIEVVFEKYPWKRAVSLFKNGEVDAISYFSKTSQRLKYTYYFEENIVSKINNAFVILKNRKDEIQFNGDLKALKGFVIGVQSGFKYGDTFDLANYLEKYEVKHFEQVETLLRKKRIDLGIIQIVRFKEFYKGTDVLDDYIFLEPPVVSNANYIGFSKKRNHLKLAKAFAKEMASFKKTKQFQKLLVKYGIDRF